MSLLALSKQVVKRPAKKLVAKRINDDTATDATKQLEVFTNSLGVEAKAVIYMYGKHAYINADIVLPVLSVSVKDFKKASTQGIDYIVLKSNLYVSKYGLTKLLAASKEQAAYMLQDYIFEVMYKLETDGQVSITDVDARKQLCMKQAEIEIHEMASSVNERTVHDMADQMRALNSDYAVVNAENKQLAEMIDDLNQQLATSQSDYKNLFKQAKKLARYVRFNTVKKIKEVDELDSSGDELEEAQINIDAIRDQGMNAKRSMNKYTSKGRARRPKSKAPESKKEIKKLFYVMQSTQSFPGADGTPIHSWKIIERLPANDDILTVSGHQYNSFKEFSEDYRLGGLQQDEHDYIWYSDLIITDVMCEALKKMTDLIQYVSCETYVRIIEVFE